MIYYPLSTGRNFHELKRVLKSLQAVDKYNIATPADWEPGEEVIVPTSRIMRYSERENGWQ